MYKDNKLNVGWILDNIIKDDSISSYFKKDEDVYEFTYNGNKYLVTGSYTPDAVPQLITWSKKITLESGKLVGESLINDMPSQLDSTLKKMMNITLDGDGFCADKASILISLSPYSDGTNLYVPLKIQRRRIGPPLCGYQTIRFATLVSAAGRRPFRALFRLLFLGYRNRVRCNLSRVKSAFEK